MTETAEHITTFLEPGNTELSEDALAVMESISKLMAKGVDTAKRKLPSEVLALSVQHAFVQAGILTHLTAQFDHMRDNVQQLLDIVNVIAYDYPKDDDNINEMRTLLMALKLHLTPLETMKKEDDG